MEAEITPIGPAKNQIGTLNIDNYQSGTKPVLQNEWH